MLLVACAVIFELCLAAVLWRISRQRPGIASEISAVFIAFAAACSIGLAVQGCFLYAVDVLQASELAQTLFWLTAGIFAFAVAFALRASPTSASLPCLTVAVLFLIYGIVTRNEMAVVVGSVLAVTAIIVCSFARRVRARSAQFELNFKRSSACAVTER
jgi:hypothetical protein